MRKIKYIGDIKDNICPIYYWCQVQLQLECCNLDECDFIQCNIEEYKGREEWLDDTNDQCDYKSQKYGLERGLVLEMLPLVLNETDFIDCKIKDQTIYDKATHIYPPKIDMTIKELDSWILNQIALMENNNGLRLHRIIYWRLIEKNCTLIKRDIEWFKLNLDNLKTMWGYVEFLREHSDVVEEWKIFINSLTKKYNEKIMDKLRELINKKNNLNKESSEEDVIIIKSKRIYKTKKNNKIEP